MSNEQKIREEYAKRSPGDEEHFDYLSFYAGYMALLNELELFRKDLPLYRLPEGVEKP